ncbi:hypothetical protein [Histidinibacterium aquaticum]|uniref:Uncharacterized protein n=1 Tax=Histidinibacterium aquaticum TaxID=2613962 RepID=A0A5J5GD71_9RHOB|nr:hypothetical protein [Histidinibacterium aquaticum]KAA9005763.1 hypothetical protein F3S47_17870 [Histidinibacterium aquaticum]
MLTRLIRAVIPARLRPTFEERIADVRARFEERQMTRDIGGIMGALDRLSDRQLQLIGSHRQELYDFVSDLMDRAAEQRRIGDEIIEILEASERRAQTVTPAVSDDTGADLPANTKAA